MKSWMVILKELPKKRSGIFRINPHATFIAPFDDENIIQKSITPFRKGG